MILNLPTEQQAFISGLVQSGRFASVNDAISEGIRLLVSQEQFKQEIQVGIQQADRGELTDHATVFKHLRSKATAVVEGESGQ